MKFKMRGLNPFTFRLIVCWLGFCAPGLLLLACRDNPGKTAHGAKPAVSSPAEERKLIIPGQMIRVTGKVGAPPVSQEAREVDVHELLKDDGIERIELVAGSETGEVDPRWKSIRLREAPVRFEVDLSKARGFSVKILGVEEKLDALFNSEEDVYSLLSADVPSSEGRPVPLLKIGVFYFGPAGGG